MGINKHIITNVYSAILHDSVMYPNIKVTKRIIFKFIDLCKVNLNIIPQMYGFSNDSFFNAVSLLCQNTARCLK